MSSANLGVPKGRLLARAFLLVWIPGLCLAIGSLMTGHWVTLPVPKVEDPVLVSGLAELNQPAGESWAAYHVLYADCRCSQRVLDYLMESERPADLREVVLLVGVDESFSKACRDRGFELVQLSQAELEAQYGVVSAPLFLIADPSGQIRIASGYTERKQGPSYIDLDTLKRLRSGESVVSAPVFGCGVSETLQDALDPLGLQY